MWTIKTFLAKLLRSNPTAYADQRSKAADISISERGKLLSGKQLYQDVREQNAAKAAEDAADVKRFLTRVGDRMFITGSKLPEDTFEPSNAAFDETPDNPKHES
ncbi:hypothetical protein AB4Z10_07470 [Bosea sp. RAF48]|uniref:hypothetical protein n=1 Tax=Bosea sp. RAF48 TaxID=3237480 RepID=UPI003F8F911F